MKHEPPQPPPAPLPRVPVPDAKPHIPPEGRDEKGRIKPGFGGRQKGSRNKVSREAVKAVQDLSPIAIQGLAVLIRQTNFAAIKYCLDYVLPRDGRTIDLDGTSDPHKLIEAVTSGEISPSEFARITQGMKAALDAAELKELKAQVDDLEQLIGALKK